jgi:hypothetical protein
MPSRIPRQVSHTEAALEWPGRYLAEDDRMRVLSRLVQRVAFYLSMGRDMEFIAKRIGMSLTYLHCRYWTGLDLIAAGLRARQEPVF